MPDTSSLDLVLLAQQGDDDALGALYDMHYHPVLHYFWAKLGDYQQAEDLTGDVFHRMITALPRFRPIGLPFRAWLFKIAHNVLVDYYRLENSQKFVSLDDTEHIKMIDEDPARIVPHKLTMDQAFRALSKLEPFQRDVLALRFLAGLSLKDTGLALGKTEDAVKAIQRRGLSILRFNLSSEKDKNEPKP